MNRRIVYGIVVLLIICNGFVQAGGNREDGIVGFSVTDAAGRVVEFSAEPMRIVVAGRGVIPLVDAAYFFPEARERFFSMVKTDQGHGTFAAILDDDFLGDTIIEHTISPEDVVACKPDCVLLKSYMAETLGNPLENLGIPVVYLDMESPEQFQRDVRIIGRLFGNEARAEEVLAYYDDQASTIASLLEGRDTGNDPSVLFIYHSQKGGEISFNVPPAAWLQTELVVASGGDPVWTSDAVGKGWMKVGIEQIAQWNPDVIFLTDYFTSVDDIKAGILDNEAWKNLRAVKEDRFYAFPADFYSWDQPDARWILALKWMASVLHPDLVPAFSVEDDVKAFFADIYGMNTELIDDEILSRLTGDVRR